MPIASKRHREKRQDGKPVFIIQPVLLDEFGNPTNRINKEFSGRRCRVEFRNGIGRTVYKERALELMEQNGYLVTLPEGFETSDLGYVMPRRAKTAPDMLEPAPDYVLEDEDEDGDGFDDEDDLIG